MEISGSAKIKFNLKHAWELLKFILLLCSECTYPYIPDELMCGDSFIFFLFLFIFY